MTTTDNLIDLDYSNNPFDLYDKTIWDIKNNEKKQLIAYLDNIISTKFEKKITEQNDIITKLKEENNTMKETIYDISAKFEKKITEQNDLIKQLREENKKNNITNKINDTLNNLLFDLARHNVFHINQCHGLEKYHNNIIAANQLIELDYIDYDFVSVELEEFYSTINHTITYIGLKAKAEKLREDAKSYELQRSYLGKKLREEAAQTEAEAEQTMSETAGGKLKIGKAVRGIVEKDITNVTNFVKKLYLNPNELSNINFKDKIFRGTGPMVPAYFQKFIKTMNIRREYFQHDSGNGYRLIIYIMDSKEENDKIKQYPNIKFNFIPNVKFEKPLYGL
jgi:hypothetical protein